MLPPSGPRTWLPLALLALAYLLVLARIASDHSTNFAGAAAALLLWDLCTIFSLCEAGVTRGTLRLRLSGASRHASSVAATVTVPVSAHG